MLIITIPMCIMLFFLSSEAYSIFYGNSEYGSLILKFSSISHIFFGVWTVLNTTLQSMKKFKLIYLNSVIGLCSNALLDIPMILLLNKLGLPSYIGTILATCTGFTISTSIVIHHLRKDMKFNFKDTINMLKKLVLPTIILIVLLTVSKLFIHFEYNRITSLISIMIHGIIGVIIYLYITYKNGVLYKVFGEEFINKILKKLKLAK